MVSDERSPRGARAGWFGCTMVGMLLSACSPAPTSAPQGAAPRPALVVTPVRAQIQRWPDTLSAQGSIAPWHEALVSAEVAGLRVAEVKVDVGAKVRRGQVLATLNDAPVRADLAVAQAQLAQAQAQRAETQVLVNEAQANAERARVVEPSGALSAQQIAQYQSAAQSAVARHALAQAAVQAAQAQVQAQQLRWAMTQVRAPDDGLIATRTAQVGAVVGTGQELFRLVRGQRLEWRAEVMASELSSLRPGQAVRIASDAGAAVDGVVRQIGPVLDPQSRKALVYVDLPLASPLRSGMFARGDFALGMRAGALVPSAAVVVREGLTYLFTLDGDRVVQRKVRTGRQLADMTEILEGLPPDAELVGQGAGFLNDGDLIARAGAGSAP
jgi:HlyD family secretion protein